MSMQTWAEKEIEIACKREREAYGVENDGDWDYGCACYESALKAFKSLMGLVTKIIDEMFPITMPYSPGKAIAVYCEDFLTDKKNGDFDTLGIFYAIKPDGEKVEINRFFKESEDGWDEIDEDEYNKRKSIKIM